MEPQRIGNYTVERRLGGGGVGEVYLARSRGLHGVAKQVVIKRLRGDRELNGRRVRAFLDEARLAARLSHQNICQVIELGEGDGEFFLVMEHIDGPTLAQLASGALKAAVPLPHAAAAFIVAQVCAGLSHAHDLRDGERSLDVIHRDVSPQNVLISREGEVKLIDFGIAKSALRQERTRAGIIKGKARYMSPEQARAMRVDHRTDVFSAGVVLYELLAGRRRGDGLARDELARVVREGVLDLEPLRAAAVPEALIAAVERAVATDVEARWPTAAAFGEAIEAWLRGAQAAYGRRDVAQLVQTLFPPQIEGEQGSASANKLETDRVEMEPLKIESVTHETVRERPAAQAQAQALPTAEEEAAPASARPFAPAPQAELAARGTVILPPPRATAAAVALVLVAAAGLTYTVARSLGSAPAPARAPSQAAAAQPAAAAQTRADGGTLGEAARKRERALYAALIEARQRGDHLAALLLFEQLAPHSPYRRRAAKGRPMSRREAISIRAREVSSLISRGACAEARWQARLVRLLATATNAPGSQAARASIELERRAHACSESPAATRARVALKTAPVSADAGAAARAADAGPPKVAAAAGGAIQRNAIKQDDWVISSSRIFEGRRRGASDAQLRRTVMLARQAYVAGQHQRALLLARRVLSQRKRGDLAQQALRVLGSAGCQSGDRQAVRRALRGLGVRYRTMLIQVCRRVGHDVR